MLYRRHLRIKVLQALYSWYTGGVNDIVVGEKELLKSIDKLHNLFVYQLSFLVEIKRFAEVRIEENKRKFYPTDEDLNPNTRFIENQVLTAIEHNNEFILSENKLKVNWTEEEDMVLKFFNMLKAEDFFQEYMATKPSLDKDKELLLKITEYVLPEFELLKSYYDEKCVYFNDGYDLVNILLYNFFDNFKASFASHSKLPGIYKPSVNGKNEDRDFVRIIYKLVIRDEDKLNEELKERTKNWEFDRIPLMDLILLKMAIVELQKMETIPVKVTLNEYIELTKYFSTQNSKVFINGVLDRLIREFKEQGKIVKTGRGLVD